MLEGSLSSLDGLLGKGNSSSLTAIKITAPAHMRGVVLFCRQTTVLMTIATHEILVDRVVLMATLPGKPAHVYIADLTAKSVYLHIFMLVGIALPAPAAWKTCPRMKFQSWSRTGRGRCRAIQTKTNNWFLPFIVSRHSKDMGMLTDLLP